MTDALPFSLANNPAYCSLTVRLAYRGDDAFPISSSLANFPSRKGYASSVRSLALLVLPHNRLLLTCGDRTVSPDPNQTIGKRQSAAPVRVRGIEVRSPAHILDSDRFSLPVHIVHLVVSCRVLAHPDLEAARVPGVRVGKEVRGGLKVVLPLAFEDSGAVQGENLDLTAVLCAELVELPGQVEKFPAGLLSARDVDQGEIVDPNLAKPQQMDVLTAEPFLIFVGVPGDLEFEDLYVGKVFRELWDRLPDELERLPVARREIASVGGVSKALQLGRVKG